MLALSNNLIDRPILSLRSGGRIGTALEPIVNPHNLQIIGWWCDNLAEESDNVLMTSDVREVLPTGIVIDDSHNFSNPEDLARQKEVLDTNYKIIGKQVRTEHQKIGKVADYVYDSTFLIQKIHVEQSLLKALAQDTRIIGRNQIIEVTDKYILVKDSSVKAGAQTSKLSDKLADALLPNT